MKSPLLSADPRVPQLARTKLPRTAPELIGTAELGLGRVKTSALVASVEHFREIAPYQSQTVLRTHGQIPSRRIVFSTFCGCMSFYTARVKTGSALVQQKVSASSPIVLQKPPSRLCEIEICNNRIGASVLLNRYCSFVPDLESMFRDQMSKILCNTISPKADICALMSTRLNPP